MFKFRNVFYPLLMLIQPAYAIVNIEQVKLDSNKESFSGELNISFSGASGVSDKSAVSLSSRMQWDDTSTQFVIIKRDFEESSGVKSTDKSFMHYRYIRDAQAQFSWEAFTQIENDKFKLLKLRTLVGGGSRILIHKDEDTSLARIGLGAFSSREEYDDTASTIEEVVRANIYFTYHYRFTKGLRFNTTTYYQPDINDTEDYRALEQLSFEFDISKGLTYFVKLDSSYDNKPVQTISKHDTTYTSGIKFSF
jgi:putative salt-induced outer membrane protein YdiY